MHIKGIIIIRCIKITRLLEQAQYLFVCTTQQNMNIRLVLKEFRLCCWYTQALEWNQDKRIKIVLLVHASVRVEPKPKKIRLCCMQALRVEPLLELDLI